MADITIGGNPINTTGTIPQVGEKIKDFKLVAPDMSIKSLADYKGKKLVLNIFPSVGTGVCAKSVHGFNSAAGSKADTVVLNISKDLPFAQKAFCGAEGLDNVEMLSDFRPNDFSANYNTVLLNGPFEGLHSRVVIVADAEGNVMYSEQVPEIGQEPNYDAALSSL